MDNDTIEVAVPKRNGGKTAGENWGAKDSLRRNAELYKTADDEVTPLLASGDREEEDNDDRRSTEWEGHADFDGLPWWRKPSVSSFRSSCGHILTAIGVLAITPILSLISRNWWHCRSETQSHPKSHMRRVLHREVPHRSNFLLHTCQCCRR
jgi:hypothetical protein